MKIHVSDKDINKIKTVLVDGVDVTNNCYYADDYLNIALCLKRNEEGFFYKASDSYPDRQILTGKVEIILKEKSEYETSTLVRRAQLKNDEFIDSTFDKENFTITITQCHLLNTMH